MVLESPAKVNLVLSVSSTRDDAGYHLVNTVLCPLGLSDEVEVTLSLDEGVHVVCDPDPIGPDVADHVRANLAYKAAVAFAKAFDVDPRCSIRIKKNIPSQAGLGGGSSNAAAVIRALAQLWGVQDASALANVASSIGADVAFFLGEGPAVMSGRGDVLVRRLPAFSSKVVLVKPDAGVSTAQAYRTFDAMGCAECPMDALVSALETGDAQSVWLHTANNLTQPALAICPELNDVFAYLEPFSQSGAPLLCGSGSCVALPVDGDDVARRVAHGANERGWWSAVTETRGC